ncbi:unnamed protein product [Schistosoma margrebowiei]|uniref:Uncharacterized protein n=1 Tax=Schistosoma margrebowiei TaxID=48269 RepID=A0A183N6W4_9TREM|nr:unnamed protein product [Schistosoma margrebowiei]
MVIGGSQQETLDPGFMLIGARQQGVPIILRELVLLDGFNPVSPSFTVKDVTTLLGTRQQGIPIILRELVLPDGFDPVLPRFTVEDVTTELSESRPTSCRSEL